MSMPIQRQSEAYGAFDDGSHRFAKDYETHDLPEGLVGMLAGRRISAGLNNPRAYREADVGAAMDSLGDTFGQEANRGFDGTLGGFGSALGDAASNIGGGLVDAGSKLFDPKVTQGTPTAPAGVGTPPPTNINASHQAGFGAYPDSSGFGREDLSGHGGYDPQAEDQDYFDQAPPTQDPGGFGFGGYEDYDPHSSENLPPDYGAQFGPHMSSFTTARRHCADGGPGNSTEDLNGTTSVYGGEDKVAAAVQPQVVPGWVGHGYSPGHRVGLPWREQLIKGTVTHLPGQEVGIRWDDGQHSTEQPSDLRPI